MKTTVSLSAESILTELKALGRDSYKRVLLKHGVKEPCFGVKIEDLKKILKRAGRDHRLALNLYDSGIYDAMYLAGLMADDSKMTRRDLQRWLKSACGPLAGTTVPGVAAGSREGHALALEWIESTNVNVAVAGWTTLSLMAAVKDDAELNIAELQGLVQRVERTIHQAPDLVRYQMNAFVISVGVYVRALTETALAAAEKIGPVTADLGDNACQVPSALESIRKVESRGAIGRKRKSARC